MILHKRPKARSGLQYEKKALETSTESVSKRLTLYHAVILQSENSNLMSYNVFYFHSIRNYLSCIHKVLPYTLGVCAKFYYWNCTTGECCFKDQECKIQVLYS